MKTFFLLVAFLLAGCTTYLPNGCVVDAASHRAALQATHKLEPYFWSRELIVRYYATKTQHAYCVWVQDGATFAYDEASGAFAIRPKGLSAMSLADAIEGQGTIEAAVFFP